MTLEERLNEIVEKQQGDAIIPFLQGLTQEERKSLVPASLGGKGVGSQLAEKALTDIERQGLRLVPLCPFVAGYIHKHPEWKRIVMRGIHIK